VPKTQVHLLLAQTSAKPGDTVQAALQMKMQAGWHTYWRNPGDAGITTTVEWELPAGLTNSPFLWPVPKKMLIAKLIAYVYENEVLLPFTFKIPGDAKPGTISLKGAADWLECSDTTCVPQNGDVKASLTIGEKSEPSGDAASIAEWLARIPKADASFVGSAKWEGPPQEKNRSLVIEWTPKTTPLEPDFFPYEQKVHAKTEILQADATKVRVRKLVDPVEKNWPSTILALVLDKSGDEQGAREVSLKVENSNGPALATTHNSNGPSPAPINLGDSSAPKSLWVLLGLAFLGGLILNIMPCVLPVIALKILGFVNQSHEEPRRIRELGIIYGLGVLTSFLVLAGVIIGVKQGGGDASWGMQMQNPVFVIVMTVLVTLVALNLFGLFEISLPGTALGAASGLASREGRAGAFYNGVLATLLATPCTAPALAAAVGSAITQDPKTIVLTFASIGFGLAFPYVLLSWNPKWLKFLPKPGVWMERFKIAMGFPMMATAIWLLYIASYHFGQRAILWIGMFLTVLAAAAWIYGQFIQRGAKHRGLAFGIMIALLLFDYFWILEGKLHWRKVELAASGAGAPGEIANSPGDIQWEKWSPEAVEKARAAGRPVFIDFTAIWCLTCQFNKESSIEIDSVKAKLKEINAVPLLADFTGKSPIIAKELKRFNRAGVPLVVVFPADPNAAPIVLPEILTPSIVLNALELASPKKAEAPKSTS